MGSGGSTRAAPGTGPCQANTGIHMTSMDPQLSKKYMSLDQNGKVQAELLGWTWQLRFVKLSDFWG